MSCACPQSRAERAAVTNSTTTHCPRRSVISGVTHPLEVLPLRVRLVALLVSLLLVALTLTSIATSAVVRRQRLAGAARAPGAPPVPPPSRVLGRLFTRRKGATPTNPAIKF